MSTEQVERAFKGVWIPADAWLCHDLGNCTRKMVLIALAGESDESGVCSVSYDDIAVICSINARSAIRNVKQLEQAGFITKFSPGGNYANVYRLTIANGDAARLEVHV